MSGPTAVTSFSPALHRQLQVVSLVFAGTASVCVWDVLNNLQAEYRMLKKSKFGLASVAYIASRVGSLIYSLGILLFSTYPLQDCAASLHAFEAFYPIATTGSAYLFYARLRAVSGFNRAITFTFALLWLCVLGTSLLIPIVGKAASVNNVCLYTSSDDYSGAAGITILVYDTAVFLTISYQLVGNYGLDVDPTDSARGTACSWDRARWFISGKNLPAFSKTLLTEGQVYYMITVLVNVVAIALVYAPQDLGIYHIVAVIPSLVLTSIMACRVYRRTKLGLVREGKNLTFPTLPTVNFDRPRARPQSVSSENENERTLSKPDGTELASLPRH